MDEHHHHHSHHGGHPPQTKNLCGVCKQSVTVGLQCAICDVWYHSNSKRGCVPLEDQTDVPFICSFCNDDLKLKDFRFSSPMEELEKQKVSLGKDLTEELGAMRTVSFIKEKGIFVSKGHHHQQQGSSGSLRGSRDGSGDGPPAVTGRKNAIPLGSADELNDMMLSSESMLLSRSTPVSFSFGASSPDKRSPRSARLKVIKNDIQLLRRMSLNNKEVFRRRSEFVASPGGGVGGTPPSGDGSDGRRTPSTGTPPNFKEEKIRRARKNAEMVRGYANLTPDPQSRMRIPLSQIEEANPDEDNQEGEADILGRACNALVGRAGGASGTKSGGGRKGKAILSSAEPFAPPDVFFEGDLAERHRDVITEHRRMYHRNLPPFVFGDEEERGVRRATATATKAKAPQGEDVLVIRQETSVSTDEEPTAATGGGRPAKDFTTDVGGTTTTSVRGLASRFQASPENFLPSRISYVEEIQM